MLRRVGPLSWIARLAGLSARLVRPAPARPDSGEVTEDELVALASEAAQASLIEDSEAALIGQIIELGDTIVRAVMVPRPDMVTVGADDSIDAALETVISSGFTRFPVIGTDVDDVRGIVLAKDLIAAHLHGNGRHVSAPQPGSHKAGSHRAGSHQAGSHGAGSAATCADVLRKATFVPETKRVSQLMGEMQESKSHLAIAVDEYGGVAGLVTLEDIIEELVGEISDEFDDDPELVQMVNPSTYHFSGRLSASRLAHELDLRLPEGDWDTVGGLVLDRLGHVPEEGESTELDGWRLSALEVQGRRISLVRAVRSPTQAGNTA